MKKIDPIKITNFCKEDAGGGYNPFNGQKPVLLICAATLCHSALCLAISVGNTWSIFCAAQNPLQYWPLFPFLCIALHPQKTPHTRFPFSEWDIYSSWTYFISAWFQTCTCLNSKKIKAFIIPKSNWYLFTTRDRLHCMLIVKEVMPWFNWKTTTENDG